MKFRVSHSLLSILTALFLFVAGFVVGQLSPPAVQAALQGADDAYLQRFQRVWQLLHEEYVEQPLDDEALIQGAISGMLETLGDPHTSYMPPDEFARLNEEFSGSYSGIGALVEAEGERLFIVSPYEGSPAERAGLRPADEIVRVDDTWIVEFEDPMAAITLVRGPEGEPVTLLVRRDGEVFEVTLVRATIPLISVSGELRDDRIGYVRVSDFGDQTETQLRAALTEILAGEPAGLILDLRGNPGGSLNSAIGVTSEFIGDGPIMVEQWGSGSETRYVAKPGGLATSGDLPLVVLVDGGSASASEIVAGAIQARGRGTVLGETTYGKGTVQNWHDLGEGNGGVRITIARWLTPDGAWIHEQGVTPDVEVVPSDADWESGRDLQLESAVALLLGQPLPASQADVALPLSRCRLRLQPWQGENVPDPTLYPTLRCQ